MPDKFKIYSEIIEVLEKGGMTKKYPFVMQAVRYFHESSYTKSIDSILKKYPQILHQARRNVLEQKEFPFWPPPYKKYELEKLKGKYDIGIINPNGDRAYINKSDLKSGLTLLGQIGSGKSYPVLRILKQILSEPIEQRGFNVLIIQASKNDADFLIRYNKDLLVMDWKDVRRSPLYIEEWDIQEQKINSFCEIYQTNNWLMAFGQPLFRNAVKKCIDKYGTQTDFHKIFNNVDFSAKDIGIQGPEHKNIRDNLRSTLFSFRETGKILNCHKGLTVKDFFTKKDIILNIQPTQLPSKYVLATFLSDLFKDIQRYYLNNPLSKNANSNLRTLIVIDECRRVFPNSNTANKSGHEPNEPMIDFVTTRRSSGIGLIAVTQEPSSAPDWLVINSAYVLSMAISGKGRKDIREIINLSKDQASFMDHFSKFGVGIMRYHGYPKRFLIGIPGDLDDTPIPPDQVRMLMKDKIKSWIEPIDQQYKLDIQKEIVGLEQNKEEQEKKQKEQKMQNMTAKQERKFLEMKLDAITIMETLSKNPFIHKTGLRNATSNNSASRIDKAIEYLTKENLAVVVKCVSEAGKPKTNYIALTDSAKEYLNKKTAFINPTHFKHTMYKLRVASVLKFKGYETKVEYSNESKTAFIDVFAINNKLNLRIAYEVTLSFSNLKKNVYKCLNEFEVDELVIVTENKNNQSIAMNIISNQIEPKYFERITYTEIKDFKK